MDPASTARREAAACPGIREQRPRQTPGSDFTTGSPPSSCLCAQGGAFLKIPRTVGKNSASKFLEEELKPLRRTGLNVKGPSPSLMISKALARILL